MGNANLLVRLDICKSIRAQSLAECCSALMIGSPGVAFGDELSFGLRLILLS